MASSELTFEQVLKYLVDKGGKVKNREAVNYFKRYLTHPESKGDARAKFKQYINALAYTKREGDEACLYLKSKYINPLEQPLASPSPITASPSYDPRNEIGIPLSPSSLSDFSPSRHSPRQPPPYRPPPPAPSPSVSMDNISLASFTNSLLEVTPQAPPRRRSSDKLLRSFDDDVTPKKAMLEEVDDKQKISVKERTQKFNRLASVEDELSPRLPKSAEKSKISLKGSDEDDGALDKPLESKKCVEWYVTASKGDLQELLKLAKNEPRLVNKKDPFTAYTVLHWGAKYGQADIIKVFAGTHKVDVNGKTNGGYTPLHIAAQFGHQAVFKLLIEVFKADPNVRDYSGKTAAHYLSLHMEKNRLEGPAPLHKLKGRKKQSEKDLGFLRIGSLNVRVKKTTEAFSNFLGVGTSVVNPMDSMVEKVHKGWGSADNLTKDDIVVMGAPNKNYVTTKKKSKRPLEVSSTPTTPKSSNKSLLMRGPADSDSDSAAGFDSNWKN